MMVAAPQLVGESEFEKKALFSLEINCFEVRSAFASLEVAGKTKLNWSEP
jgi:hypothetical protein